MLHSLPAHIPPSVQQELSIVTERICQTGKAEMIVLFGSYARGDYRMEEGLRSGAVSDLDLLVVTRNSEHSKQLERDLANTFADIGTTVQLVIESAGFINQKLEQGRFFYVDIRREGVVLYDSGNYTLATPQTFTTAERRAIVEADFKKWMELTSGIYNNLRPYPLLAAFDLQQVAESCYKTVLIVFSHYIPKEHHLHNLRKKAVVFCREIDTAFPLDTPAHIDSFRHLNLAYIGGRYPDSGEYAVTEEQLHYWRSEAGRLLSFTVAACEAEIDRLKQREQESD